MTPSERLRARARSVNGLLSDAIEAHQDSPDRLITVIELTQTLLDNLLREYRLEVASLDDLQAEDDYVAARDLELDNPQDEHSYEVSREVAGL